MRLRTGSQVKEIPPDFQILTSVTGQVPVGIVGESLRSGGVAGSLRVRQRGQPVAGVDERQAVHDLNADGNDVTITYFRSAQTVLKVLRYRVIKI